MRTLLAAVLALVVATPALAQQAALQITRGPYNTGIPVEMHVVAEGFEEDPMPEVSAATPDGTTLNFVQARPQVSSSMQIVNGRISQSREVRFAFVYQLTANAPGRYSVGPFTVTQAGVTATTNSITLTVVDVPQAGGQKLRVLMPDHPVFVGQRVPVTVEWWTQQGVADSLFNQRLHIPLFLDTTHFQMMEEKIEESRVVIGVDMPGGLAEIPVDVRQIVEDSKTWVIRSFTRTVVPVSTGRYDLGTPTLYCEEATAFQRDFFGSRVPSQSRQVQVRASQVTLDVQTLPATGRPGSFGGAIGQGFTIEVHADRTVLQTGDPMTLSFTIRGDGALDSASLPPLSQAGLSPTQFRLPEGEVAGRTDAGGKHFEVPVRVLDPQVTSIPPIQYSWFDPATQQFQTTQSQPIALSVRAATVIGAGDVVSAAPAQPVAQGPANAATPGQAAGAGAAKTPNFTLTGADLSIETDVARLQRSSTSLLGSATTMWAGYLGGFLALGAGLVVRRRRSVDPVKATLQRELRGLRSHVARDRSAKQVADALRKMAALGGNSGARPADLDSVLALLDETAFAPGGADAAVAESLRKQALAVADAVQERAR